MGALALADRHFCLGGVLKYIFLFFCVGSPFLTCPGATNALTKLRRQHLLKVRL